MKRLYNTPSSQKEEIPVKYVSGVPGVINNNQAETRLVQ